MQRNRITCCAALAVTLSTNAATQVSEDAIGIGDFACPIVVEAQTNKTEGGRKVHDMTNGFVLGVLAVAGNASPAAFLEAMHMRIIPHCEKNPDDTLRETINKVLFRGDN